MCFVTWDNETISCEARADIGAKSHIEAIGEDANISSMGQILISSSPRHSSISHREHAHMLSLPEPFCLKERPMETLI